MKTSDLFRNTEARAIKLGLFKHTFAEAQQTGCCMKCGEHAAGKAYSPAGIREFALSGICEPCYDELFSDSND